MRGQDAQTSSMFSYVDLEERITAGHPLHKIREFVNAALAALDATFAEPYSDEGRPSIAPERLLRAALIQILFSIRSERQLMEQMQYNLLFRWFVGLGIDDPVWVPTVFTKNRDRLLNTDIARQFLAAMLAHKEVEPPLSDEHFSVDGTLIEAWASMKSFKPKPGVDGIETAASARRRPLKHRLASQTRQPKRPQRTRCLRHRSRSSPLPQGRGQAGQALLYGPCLDGKASAGSGFACERAARADRARRGGGLRRTGLSVSRLAPIRAMTPKTSTTS